MTQKEDVPNTVAVTVRLTRRQKESLDKTVSNGQYKDISEAIRDAVRRLLIEEVRRGLEGGKI